MAAGDTAWYAFVRGLVRNAFFRPLGGIKTFGEENIPGSGAVILAPTHFSLLDPPAVACGIRRQLSFMAKEELFRGLFGKIIFSVGAFPIRRGAGDREALKLGLSRLAEGRALLMFPEGTRGDGKRLGALNKGVGLMAKQSGCPVVPAAIIGTHVMWPRGQKKIRRHGAILAFGPAIRFGDFMGDGPDRAAHEAFAHALRAEMLRLAAEHGLVLTSGEPESGSPSERPPAGPDATESPATSEVPGPR